MHFRFVPITIFTKVQYGHVSIIMITARISPDLKKKGDELGISAWMPKPLKKDVILNVLEDLESKKLKREWKEHFKRIPEDCEYTDYFGIITTVLEILIGIAILACLCQDKPT